MKRILAVLALTSCLTFAQPPNLALARDKNWLVIQGPHLPMGEIRINYLEEYCRANSTTADWHDTTIRPPHSPTPIPALSVHGAAGAKAIS